jgi:uncharacterized protein YbjQ (UPF0145 family)
MSKSAEFVEKYQQFLAELPEAMQLFFANGTSVTEIAVKNGLQTLLLAFVGWALASYLEHRHNKQMTQREAALQDISVSTAKHDADAESGIMIYGSVVISHDLFRTLFIQLRKVVGGNIKAYERLVTRGRREAFIRLQEDARLRGFDKIINVRFAGSRVAGRFMSAVEMVAYGTGVKSK